MYQFFWYVNISTTIYISLVISSTEMLVLTWKRQAIIHIIFVSLEYSTLEVISYSSDFRTGLNNYFTVNCIDVAGYLQVDQVYMHVSFSFFDS